MSFVEILDQGQENIGGKSNKIDRSEDLQEMTAVVDVSSKEEYHPHDIPYKFEGQEHNTSHSKQPATLGMVEDNEKDDNVVDKS